MENASVIAVCASAVSGLPRPEIAQGELREDLGLVGNKHSVGGKREICLFDMETYESLRGEGMKVGPGSFGENLVLSGIPFQQVKPGDRIAVGDAAEIEVTMVRAPCANLTQIDARLPEGIVGRSGWMAQVVRGGTVKPGDPARWTSRQSE